MGYFYRLDDDRLLRDQERDRPVSPRERSHHGQQADGCHCHHCIETRTRLRLALAQFTREQAQRRRPR